MEEIVRTQIMIMRVSVDFSRFTFILVTLALLVLVGCSRPPEIIGIDNPELRAEAEALSTRHRIFITSTRAPSDEPGALLSANRARTLGLASVDVLSIGASRPASPSLNGRLEFDPLQNRPNRSASFAGRGSAYPNSDNSPSDNPQATKTRQ